MPFYTQQKKLLELGLTPPFLLFSPFFSLFHSFCLSFLNRRRFSSPRPPLLRSLKPRTTNNNHLHRCRFQVPRWYHWSQRPFWKSQPILRILSFIILENSLFQFHLRPCQSQEDCCLEINRIIVGFSLQRFATSSPLLSFPFFLSSHPLKFLIYFRFVIFSKTLIF